MMNVARRAQRRHDLQLAATVLRREIDASLTSLKPAVEPALHGLAIGLWLRRRRAASGLWVAALLAAGGVAIGGGGIGRFVQRHRRWLRRLWLAWALWKPMRR